MRCVWRCLGCRLPGVGVGLGRVGGGGVCGRMWCGLMHVHVLADSHVCVLRRCCQVRASCVSAALRDATCVALPGVSSTWCGRGLERGGGGVCGRMWCGLMHVHVLADSHVCVLCRCYQVWASCMSAALRDATCVALPGVSSTWCGRGIGRGWGCVRAHVVRVVVRAGVASQPLLRAVQVLPGMG